MYFTPRPLSTCIWFAAKAAIRDILNIDQAEQALGPKQWERHLTSWMILMPSWKSVSASSTFAGTGSSCVRQKHQREERYEWLSAHAHDTASFINHNIVWSGQTSTTLAKAVVGYLHVDPVCEGVLLNLNPFMIACNTDKAMREEKELKCGVKNISRLRNLTHSDGSTGLELLRDKTNNE